MNLFGLMLLIMTSVRCSSDDVDGVVAALCSTSHYCPPPWLAFHGHCYMWVDTPMSWMDAERHCQMLPYRGKMVHLASIHSQEENEFIRDYVKSASGFAATPKYWIGYNDIDWQNHFKWSDGSDGSYGGWYPGEPSNTDWRGIDEDCVERIPSYRHEWNDRRCDVQSPFICKV